MVGGGGSIGVGERALWVITGTGGNVLRRYSADGGAEEAKISLPSHSSAALVAFGSIWITGTGNDELYRIDPTTNQIAATTELDSRPRVLAAGEGSVWVFNDGTGSVQRIDGESGKLLATIQTDAVGKGAIAVGGGFVWVSTHLVPIIQIDPRTNSVRSKLNLEMDEYSTVLHTAGSLWVSGTSVRRVNPPK
jgi:virginiamycin B lyase